MSVELADIARFLSRTAPFDELDDATIAEILPRLGERYFRREDTIISVGDDGEALYVVRSGGVELFDSDSVLLDTRDVGECFGHSTINGTGPSRYRMVAAADTLALVIPRAVFDDVAARHAPVREFFDTQSSTIRRQAVDVRLQSAGGDGGALPVGELVARNAVSVSPATTVADAARVMTDERVSCLLVRASEAGEAGDRPGRRGLAGRGALVGILTDRDLRSRVLAAGVPPETPVAEVMSAAPATVDAEDTVFDAALEMMDRGFNHLPVVVAGADGEEIPIGLVTATDLVRLSHADPIFIAGRIARAGSVEEIARNMGRLPHLVVGLVGRGVSAEGIGRILTSAADAATRRLIALSTRDLGQPPMEYCWVAVGSQARRELGIASDQDNALVLEREPTAAEEEYFAALTRRVNHDLAEVGLPRCPGLIEASNPEWRKTPQQWGQAAANWAARPEGEAVLEAQIFFDMRAVAGPETLCHEARTTMLAHARASSRFHSHLARSAAEWRPPLGFFRGLVVERRGEHRNSLDIKAGGIAAIVQLARLLALTHGLPEVSTAERINAAVTARALQPADATSLLAALETLRQLQIEHQSRCIKTGREPDNRISPSALSSWDRRDLRNAFAAIADHLDALALRYPINQM